MSAKTFNIWGRGFALPLLFLLLFTVAACSEPAPAILTVNPVVVEVWFDVSGSLDGSVAAPLNRELAEILVGRGVVSQIEVYEFAEAVDALRPPVAILEIPKPPKKSGCEIQGKLRFLKHEAERQRAECAKRDEAALAVYREQVTAVTNRLLSKLRVLGDKGAAPSTCLYQVLSRSAMHGPGRVSIILTDGAQEGCAKPVRPAQVGGAQVVVVLVPRKGDGNAAIGLLESRTREIKEYLPQAEVLPAFKLESALPDLIAKR